MEPRDVRPVKEARHQRELRGDLAVVGRVQDDAGAHDVRIAVLVIRLVADEAAAARGLWQIAREHQVRIVCVCA